MIDVATRGAAGDGLADDAPAIQSALDDGGWVYVPAGEYRLGSALQIQARTRLTLAPGAVLARDHPGGILTNEATVDPAGGYDGPGELLIEGGTWDMRGTVQTAYGCALSIGHATNVTIRDLTVKDTPGWHAIEINSSRDVLVDNCRFLGAVATGDRAWTEAVQIDAAVNAGTGMVPYDGTVCDDIEIRSCRVGGSGTPGTGPWPRGIGTHTAPATWHRNIRITGCVFDGLIQCGIRTYWWDRAVITGNQIVDCAGDGIAVDHNSRYTEVHGNQVIDSGRNGIVVDHSCTQINVRDNDVIGSGNSAHNTYGGIRVADSSYVRVTGNTIRRRASGAHARYGLWIENTAGGIQRHGNDCRAGGYSSGLADFSSGPVTSGGDAT